MGKEVERTPRDFVGGLEGALSKGGVSELAAAVDRWDLSDTRPHLARSWWRRLGRWGGLEEEASFLSQPL